MRKSSALPLFICSILLASLSPILVSLGPEYTDPASRSGVFYNWFYRLPIAVDQWVWPDGDGLMLSLAVAVYAFQYFAVMAALLVGIALTKRASGALSLEAARLFHRGRVAALQHSSRDGATFISRS